MNIEYIFPGYSNFLNAKDCTKFVFYHTSEKCIFVVCSHSIGKQALRLTYSVSAESILLYLFEFYFDHLNFSICTKDICNENLNFK